MSECNVAQSHCGLLAPLFCNCLFQQPSRHAMEGSSHGWVVGWLRALFVSVYCFVLPCHGFTLSHFCNDMRCICPVQLHACMHRCIYLLQPMP